jgi:hypothetical protein
MLVERRQPAAAPIRGLSPTASLRLRRRHGRAAYLLALLTDRRHTAPAGHGQAAHTQAARTLPS